MIFSLKFCDEAKGLVMRSVRFFKVGGPEVLQLKTLDLPQVSPTSLLIEVKCVGVNMIDTYHRSGLYSVPIDEKVGSGIGAECAGVVLEAGADVKLFKKGDRVATALGPLGAYSSMYLADEKKCIKIPEGISDEICASSMVKGMTARYLAKETYKVEKGTVALVYAAVGGTGSILTQWIKHLGGIVIAVVSTEEKAKLAKSLGADHTILSSEDIPKLVKQLFPNGIDVAYDSIGKATFQQSLDSLKTRGLMVSYGNASGPVENFNVGSLTSKSLYITRPSLGAYIGTRKELEENSSDLFDVILKGFVKISPPTKYKLEDAAKAHIDLQGRSTTGSLVLVP